MDTHVVVPDIKKEGELCSFLIKHILCLPSSFPLNHYLQVQAMTLE